MNYSQNCLDIIMEFEGLRLNAYLDPVGVPTIGYGSIRYPNGHRVKMGDAISVAEAEAFLGFECDNMAKQLSSTLAGIALTQNQFDALLSFCFNVGTGAFLSSTMLRKIRAHDMAGAANEFPRWNKGTVDGVKVELRGLTRRRAEEKALFLSNAPPVDVAEPSTSVQESVVKAKCFSDQGVNYVVGYTDDQRAVDILKLTDTLPDTLTQCLQTYPNLKSVSFAAPGEQLPTGPQTEFSGLVKPLIKVPNAPELRVSLLTIGMDDDSDTTNHEIRNMQSRLVDLGYLADTADAADGIFGGNTDKAVREFQADFFGQMEADGKVGPKTWGKLWGEAPPAPGNGQHLGTTSYLRLTKTDGRDKYGCVVLDLAYFRNGTQIGVLEVCSGQPRKQIFRTGPNSPSGSMEPVPEGKWGLGDVEWRAGRNNYSGAVWNNGLGPAKIRLDYIGPGRTRRVAIEIHIDWNRSTAPGTAGCIGVQSVADYKTLVSWLDESDPKNLYVDWGLGTCPAPA